MPRPKSGLTREAYVKKWHSENREKLRENMRRWRAKKKAEKEQEEHEVRISLENAGKKPEAFSALESEDGGAASEDE
jgi:hypothetical protein